jgi:DNA-binding FadR family transcriptional regulator
MERFGMARTTIREGLRILESDGLIEIRRGRKGGARVISPRLDRLAEDFAVHLQLEHVSLHDLDLARQLIEPPLAAQLARSRSAADLAALHAAIDEVAAAGDHEQFGAAALRVHETIIERAGNTTLAIFSRLLHTLLSDVYVEAAQLADAKMRQRAVRSYRKFYGLIEGRDAAGAEQNWRHTMTYTASGLPDEPLQTFTLRRSATDVLR